VGSMSKPADNAPAGKVWLVGAGPGAIDLLTVRAVRILASADIVFHDALIDVEVLALAPQAEHIAVGKRCGRHSTAQRFINQKLVNAARTHRVVVRLKGGDPMLFGRAQEEMDALTAAGIEFEVVPGITAASAASAQLRISLTRRGLSRSVALLTPRAGESEKPSQALRANADASTLVLYMASQDATKIAQDLISYGRNRNTPVVIVENASRPATREALATLAELAETSVGTLLGTLDPPVGPVLLLIGDVFGDELERRKQPGLIAAPHVDAA
jgi:uroporphyrin-III C-methyltransferase